VSRNRRLLSFPVVTRPADSLVDHPSEQLFHSGDRATPSSTRAVDITFASRPGAARTLSHPGADGAPDHRISRPDPGPCFNSAQHAGPRPAIRNIARRLVERIAAKGGECDFVRGSRPPLSAAVIMEVLGVPKADGRRMLMLNQEIVRCGRILRLVRAPSYGCPCDRSFRSRRCWPTSISTSRRSRGSPANPSDDLATSLQPARSMGAPLSEIRGDDYSSSSPPLGHDTTSIDHRRPMRALCENPDQFAYVSRTSRAWPGFIDEPFVGHAVKNRSGVVHIVRKGWRAGNRQGYLLMLC